MTAFRLMPGWEIRDAGLKEPPSLEQGEVVTNFERKAREAGSQIWGLVAIWRNVAER
ncbi:hypothetical protein D3C83_142140 [compost metagenome]